MFFKDFVSVKRQKIKRGASQTYDTPSFIYTFLYLHFKSVILGQNKTVITEIVICNRFFSGIEMHTFIAPKTMTISSQSYEL